MQSSAQKLRYVVLHHVGFGDPHYDFMLESFPDSPLMTWRAKEWPLVAGDELTRIGDHRRDYLEYEGPVSNNRGEVHRIAEGTCEIAKSEDQITVHMLGSEPTVVILSHVETNLWRVVEVGP
jgi:hypothetical protein